MKNSAVVRIVAVCLALAAAAVAQTPASQPSDDAATRPISPELLTHIQSDLAKIKTVEADFVQEKRLAVLDHVLTIKGHFAMQKPDRLVWIVRDPVGYAIRVQGEEVQQWDQDTNNVQVIHLGGDPTFKAVSDQIQAWFLGDYEQLAKNYDVSLLSEKPLSLVFVPKGGTMVSKILSRVQITFGQDDRYVDKMVIDEVGGDRTGIQFMRAQVNRPIAPDVWRIPPNEH